VVAGSAPVVTTTGVQALTNKTISGASNTVTNLPSSSMPDASRKVGSTSALTTGQTGYWSKIMTLQTAGSPILGLLLAVQMGNWHPADSAILSVGVSASATGQSSVNLKMLARGGDDAYLKSDSFKIIAPATGGNVELWVKSYSIFVNFHVYELSRTNLTGVNPGGLSYASGSAWQATEPSSGSGFDVTTNGVTVAGVPVVTTTGTATLTNKTLTGPTLNGPTFSSLKDPVYGLNLFVPVGSASAVNYLNVLNGATNSPPGLQAAGENTDISLRLISKGTGSVTVNGNHAVNKTAAVPATATSTGIVGQVAYNATHFYVCTATNTWVRAALATW
jgi:hypothetical protein